MTQKINKVQINALPEIIYVEIAQSKQVSPENYRACLIFKFDKPAPKNCFLQVARLAQNVKKYNQWRIWDEVEEQNIYGMKFSGRAWRINGLYQGMFSVIRIPEGATEFVFERIQENPYNTNFFIDTFGQLFRPTRCHSRMRNLVDSNRRNTNFYKFVLATLNPVGGGGGAQCLLSW